MKREIEREQQQEQGLGWLMCGFAGAVLLSVYGRLQMCRSPGAQRRVAPHEPAFPERQRENGTGGGQDDYKCTEVALVKGCETSK